jgi:hypothetical protein
VVNKCPTCHSDNSAAARFCADCGTSLTVAGMPGVSMTRTLEITTCELTPGR